MPRSYVDNAYNRRAGRVGMPVGSAVISSSGGGGGGGGWSSSGGGGRSYVDNSMNRSLGRVGLPLGSAVHSSTGSSPSYSNSNGEARSYVDNPMNRSLGRVGLPLGTAVHSSRGSSSSGGARSSGTYVDNPANRALGRVGLTLGSAVHSRSSQQSGRTASSSSSSSRVYADNAYNRRLGRQGLPLGTAVVPSSASVRGSDSFSAGGRRYVDNPMNRRLGRVGKLVGTAAVSSRPPTSQLDAENIFQPLLRIDAEDDNLGVILEELTRLRNEVQALHPDKEYQCDKAIGIVNRHEALLTSYQNKLKMPEWVRGGQIIPFEDLEVGEKLGGGGFGDVFNAFWNGKVVAVKKLRVQRVSQARKETFQAEVKVFSQLDHPAIIKFFGVCVTSPNLAIVMEFMGGGSMFDILHIEKRVLNESQNEQMITDCLEALKYLHLRNITHRDIKSMNIMICDDYEHCKLGDFGLALKEDSRASSSVIDHGAVGTLPYSAPEVIEGVRRLKLEELKCVDVYSMGIVLVEFLTRKIPFDKMNQHQIRKAVLDGRRPSAESIFDVTLRTLLVKCVSQEPEGRPSARSLLRKWEDLKLVWAVDRLSIVDVNNNGASGNSRATNGGLPSYLADVVLTPSRSSSASTGRTSTSGNSSTRSSRSSGRLECPVCLEHSVNTSFACGHLVCNSCVPSLTTCPKCRGPVHNPIRIFV